ncbi:MAG: iron-sulfur cluster repair di-iron protein [Bacteroidetes bacterium]|nr:iron-sulfur cluster repair di-iron protein [Bacteroidota bacterium]
MNITDQSIVGSVVAQDYRTASIFQSFGIDFCCKGNRTISEACKNKNVEISDLIGNLNSSTQQNNPATNFASWPLDLLADYIEKIHHRYVEQKILEIKPYLEKVVRVHGDRHPELNQIRKIFNLSAGELAAHMKKEEFILFPFIRKLAKSERSHETLLPPTFGTIKNPISMMEQDHEIEGEHFEQIARLTENYTPPTDACSTYRVTYALLKEFQDDLHQHLHLENNILFPKAIEREKDINFATVD